MANNTKTRQANPFPLSGHAAWECDCGAGISTGVLAISSAGNLSELGARCAACGRMWSLRRLVDGRLSVEEDGVRVVTTRQELATWFDQVCAPLFEDEIREVVPIGVGPPRVEVDPDMTDEDRQNGVLKFIVSLPCWPAAEEDVKSLEEWYNDVYGDYGDTLVKKTLEAFRVPKKLLLPPGGLPEDEVQEALATMEEDEDPNRYFRIAEHDELPETDHMDKWARVMADHKAYEVEQEILKALEEGKEGVVVKDVGGRKVRYGPPRCMEHVKFVKIASGMELVERASQVAGWGDPITTEQGKEKTTMEERKVVICQCGIVFEVPATSLATVCPNCKLILSRPDHNSAFRVNEHVERVSCTKCGAMTHREPPRTEPPAPCPEHSIRNLPLPIPADHVNCATLIGATSGARAGIGIVPIDNKDGTTQTFYCSCGRSYTFPLSIPYDTVNCGCGRSYKKDKGGVFRLQGGMDEEDDMLASYKIPDHLKDTEIQRRPARRNNIHYLLKEWYGESTADAVQRILDLDRDLLPDGGYGGGYGRHRYLMDVVDDQKLIAIKTPNVTIALMPAPMPIENLVVAVDGKRNIHKEAAAMGYVPREEMDAVVNIKARAFDNLMRMQREKSQAMIEQLQDKVKRLEAGLPKPEPTTHTKKPKLFSDAYDEDPDW